ncbi:MAG TPA: hypothetical protein VLV49_03275 [Terriglobales bacterium]|nr:hypothetical protein [Terriglobales bacterium]
MSADPHVPVKPPAAEPPRLPAEKPVLAGSVAQPGVWLHRIATLFLVFGCAAVGMLLIILPWSPSWTNNSLLWGSPQWQTFFANSFVRGVCSGLGIIDLWIGFSEALHYHEGKHS